jgi:hypothetical protein
VWKDDTILDLGVTPVHCQQELFCGFKLCKISKFICGRIKKGEGPRVKNVTLKTMNQVRKKALKNSFIFFLFLPEIVLFICTSQVRRVQQGVQNGAEPAEPSGRSRRGGGTARRLG